MRVSEPHLNVHSEDLCFSNCLNCFLLSNFFFSEAVLKTWLWAVDYFVGGKSFVLLDIKPWDDKTDMKKLEEEVQKIEMLGLLWGASKLVLVGYGIKKLQIMMTIADDLVSVDDLIEEHLTIEPCSKYVQSCDIVAFNKI